MSSPPGYDRLLSGPARVARTDRALIRVGGDERTTWLQGLVTNDVLHLQPGHRVYAAYLTPQGRMITDLWVAALDGSLVLDVPAPLAPAIRERLDQLIFAEDVQVEALPGSVEYFFGPDGPDVRGAASDAGALVADTTYGVPALVAYGDTATVLDRHGATPLKDAPSVDLEAFEVLRIEAGVPRFLVDMTEDTIPLEAGIEDRAISFTKGCYVGQEIIVRVTQRGGGRVARRLVGLLLERAPATAAGDAWKVRAAGRDVGRLTSVTWSPRLERVIAMGYVHRDFVHAGTVLEIPDGPDSVPAVVTALPFVAPQA